MPALSRWVWVVFIQAITITIMHISASKSNIRPAPQGLLIPSSHRVIIIISISIRRSDGNDSRCLLGAACHIALPLWKIPVSLSLAPLLTISVSMCVHTPVHPYPPLPGNPPTLFPSTFSVWKHAWAYLCPLSLLSLPQTGDGMARF